MDTLLALVHENAIYAHWICFFALLLAGFNFPISEDLIVITGGVLASTVIPEYTFKLYLFIYLGAVISDWEAYALGRFLGTRILEISWLRPIFRRRRVRRLNYFYHHYGIWTLFFGRFIPFGVRNGLFMTAGMGRMPFIRFVLADGLSCFLGSSLLFSLAYSFGQNHEVLESYLQTFNFMIFFVTIAGVVIGGVYLRRYWRSRLKNTSKS